MSETAAALLLGCLKVFFCRICDVTLGSMRTVLVVREKTLLASLMGFFEVFIWYIVVRDALNFQGPVLAIAVSYSAGYATGTFIGGTLAKKLVSGHVAVITVTSNRESTVPDALRAAGFGITVMNVNSSDYGEKKYYILADFDHSRLKEYEALVKSLDANAFVLVQESKGRLGGFTRPGK